MAWWSIAALAANAEPVDYVNPLVGTQSSFQLSTGNTYPAIAMPWGMNFWVPQTGKNGDGWQYTYNASKIRGFKQTHQPSPWINDYGQFSLMPTVGEPVWDENERASWFSHKAETATPYYYKVYLADYDVTAEVAPTERAAILRFTFPETDEWIFEGFMPRLYDSALSPTELYRDYFRTYVERDVRQLANLRRLTAFETFVRLLAGRVGQVLNVNALSDDAGVSVPTVKEWLSIMEASYVIYVMRPYYRNFGKRFIKTCHNLLIIHD